MTNWLKAALRAFIGPLSLRPCSNNTDSLHTSKFVGHANLMPSEPFQTAHIFDKPSNFPLYKRNFITALNINLKNKLILNSIK